MQQREPLFNLPGIIVILMVALVLIHGVREWFLTQDQDIWVLLEFSFIPARYVPSLVAGGVFPGGFGAEVWTFVTYALLHGSWTHLAINAVWLMAFGTPLARRLGTVRFLTFFAVTAAAGAALHLLTNGGSMAPMVGASASISGAMAASMRFAFQRGGPLNMMRSGSSRDYRVPALSLAEAFGDARVLAFVGIWFGINIVFGLVATPLTGADEVVAWQAHIGGFLAGLLLFSWFDPVVNSREPHNDIALH